MPLQPRYSWLLASLLLVVGGNLSARDLSHDEARRLLREGHILPLEHMLQLARERYPGAVLLEVELEEEDGTLVYEIELITQGGVVRELELDARDGRLLKDEVDD
jgi:uncharacterized membrane protein YkoI